jgi:hypothetical protein
MATVFPDKEMISEPRLWNLALRVSDSNLHVMLYNGNEPDSLISRAIALDVENLGLVRAIEEAIYDNPLLLNDFNHVDILIDTLKFAIIPDDIVDPDTRQSALDTLLPDSIDIHTEIIQSPIPATGSAIVMKIPVELGAFLRRTFNNPSIHHHLAPLCRYLLTSNRTGNSGKMYVNFRSDALDLITFSNDRPLLINTFNFRDINDAVYYIIACRNILHFDNDSNELLLAGDSEVREAITPILREFIGYVMPVIFPTTMFKAGKEALSTPFDLITLPLCV